MSAPMEKPDQVFLNQQRIAEQVLALQEKEQREGNTSHFAGVEFHVQDLTPADIAMWEKVTKQEVTLSEFRVYQGSIPSDDPELSASRKAFYEWLANEATKIF